VAKHPVTLEIISRPWASRGTFSGPNPFEMQKLFFTNSNKQLNPLAEQGKILAVCVMCVVFICLLVLFFK
jgi:hypothetical protein